MFSYTRSSHLITIFFIFIFIAGCSEGKKSTGILPTPVDVHESESITLNIYDFESLRPLLERDDENTYVINFWASWCKPCIDEMPYFEQAAKKYKDKNVVFVMVSLDFKSQIDSKLIPFLKENSIQNTVVVLSDPDANSWIPQIDESWSGAIPVTLIYNRSNREFHQSAFTLAELDSLLESFI